MSYLNAPRLIFTGDFQADVNTVNNDVRHYYNPAFTEDNWVQDVSTQGGWWNPDGGSTFRFVDCSVRQVCYPDGSKTDDKAKDPVIGKSVTGPLNESSAKLVDLDPQFQFTSQIWGLKLCIYGSENEVLLSGTVEPSGFKDLQLRNPTNNINLQPLGASWTSVVYDLKWGEKARESKILSALMDSSAETGLLACNLVSFGYFKVIGGERFTLGRLLGAIAPYTAGDPHQFAPARRIIGIKTDQPKPPQFMFSNSAYNEVSSLLTIDLGGSIPLADPLGTPLPVGTLYIGVARHTEVRKHLKTLDNGDLAIGRDEIVKIGEINYQQPDWLLRTAGMSDFIVSGEAKDLIGEHQIVLFTDADAQHYSVLACETTNGLSVRADDNVKRIDTKIKGSVDFDFTIRTFQWGKPLPGATVTFKRYTPLEFSHDDPNCKEPEVPNGINSKTGEVIQPCTNWPKEAVLVNGKQNVQVKSDDNGQATVCVSVFDPHNPRGYIDGQIFLIAYKMKGLPFEQQYDLRPLDLYLMDGLIMHVRNAFREIKEPSWSDLAEIMTQYRNLYPLMSRNIIDLGDPKEVASRKKIMLYAFTRDINDPTYMPVSRDLSEGKRKTIVNWLNTGMKEGEAFADKAAMMAAAPPPPDGNRKREKLNVKTKDDFSHGFNA